MKRITKILLAIILAFACFQKPIKAAIIVMHVTENIERDDEVQYIYEPTRYFIQPYKGLPLGKYTYQWAKYENGQYVDLKDSELYKGTSGVIERVSESAGGSKYYEDFGLLIVKGSEEEVYKEAKYRITLTNASTNKVVDTFEIDVMPKPDEKLPTVYFSMLREVKKNPSDFTLTVQTLNHLGYFKHDKTLKVPDYNTYTVTVDNGTFVGWKLGDNGKVYVKDSVFSLPNDNAPMYLFKPVFEVQLPKATVDVNYDKGMLVGLNPQYEYTLTYANHVTLISHVSEYDISALMGKTISVQITNDLYLKNTTSAPKPLFFATLKTQEAQKITLDNTRIAMHRLYNPTSGEHFYTSSSVEQTNLVQAGWKYEGIGWYSVMRNSHPVYRLYNANGGEHHYTRDISERDALVNVGWKYEGIGWYSKDEKTGVPVYRQYNPNAYANNHNYSVSREEKEMLVKAGWMDEGIAWYGTK